MTLILPGLSGRGIGIDQGSPLLVSQPYSSPGDPALGTNQRAGATRVYKGETLSPVFWSVTINGLPSPYAGQAPYASPFVCCTPSDSAFFYDPLGGIWPSAYAPLLIERYWNLGIAGPPSYPNRDHTFVGTPFNHTSLGYAVDMSHPADCFVGYPGVVVGVDHYASPRHGTGTTYLTAALFYMVVGPLGPENVGSPFDTGNQYADPIFAGNWVDGWSGSVRFADEDDPVTWPDVMYPDGRTLNFHSYTAPVGGPYPTGYTGFTYPADPDYSDWSGVSVTINRISKPALLYPGW